VALELEAPIRAREMRRGAGRGDVRDQNKAQMGLIGCPITSVSNYKSMACNIPED
jgi:hypothetical protein